MSKQICVGCSNAFQTTKRKEPKFTGWLCPECSRSDFEEYCRSVGAKPTVSGSWAIDFNEKEPSDE